MNRSALLATSLATTLGVILTGLPTASGQTPGQSAIAEAGRQSYIELCAGCHGNDARGEGPQAASLTTKPPDLTRITQRHDGEFPMPELARYIDGRDLPEGHGTRAMPAWGRQLSGGIKDKEMAERIVRGQVLELLVYLESIQQ